MLTGEKEDPSLSLVHYSHSGISFIKWIEEELYNFLFVCSVTEVC